jgi:hypothetical protein
MPPLFLLPLFSPLVAGVEQAEVFGCGYWANASGVEDRMGFAK